METTPEKQAEPDLLLNLLTDLVDDPPPQAEPLDILREAYTQLDASLAATRASYEASLLSAEAAHAALRATLDRFVAAAAGAEKFYFTPPTGRVEGSGRPAAWSGAIRRPEGRGVTMWSGLRELGRLINPKRPVAQSNLSKRILAEEPDRKGQYRFTYPGINSDGYPCRFQIIVSQKPEGIDTERISWDDFEA